jgi:hypothetical protein
LKPILLGQIDQINTQLADMAINPFNPPASLSAVKADGTDVAGDTIRLQAIINYCIVNNKKLQITKNIQVLPTLQADGTYVALMIIDTANELSPAYAKGFSIECIGGSQIYAYDTVHDYSIIRWKCNHASIKVLRLAGTYERGTGIEFSRANKTNTGEVDYACYNDFDDIRFYNLKNGLTMEGSSYYNEIRNVTSVNVQQNIWLKKTYAQTNGLTTTDSNVNRNNFYNIKSGGVNGIRLDYADTNKFYSCSGEGLTGVHIEVYDQHQNNSALYYTAWNSFYGTTNEGNNMDLIHDGYYTNFIDFETTGLNKVNMITKPLTFIPSGDSSSYHTFSNRLVQTVDGNILGYLNNRNYLTGTLNAGGFADVLGVDGSNNKRSFDWRKKNFVAGDCTNVATITFGGVGASISAMFKSMGGVMYYTSSFYFTATNVANSISIPLPELKPYQYMHPAGTGYNVSMPITYNKGNASYGVTIGRFSYSSNVLEILPPAGGWDASFNSVFVNIHYVVNGLVNFNDTN